MAERPDYLTLESFSEADRNFLLGVVEGFGKKNSSCTTEDTTIFSENKKCLDVSRTSIEDPQSTQQRYELRAGFTKIADVVATKETRVLLWHGTLPLESLDYKVFEELPQYLYPQLTVPHADVLRQLSTCAYYLKDQTEEESTQLKLGDSHDLGTYQAMMSNTEFVGGIGYKVKPFYWNCMKPYELGVADKSGENNFSHRQKIRLVVPSSVGCSSSVLQWMIGTIPQKAVDDIDPVASAHALENLIQRDRIF